MCVLDINMTIFCTVLELIFYNKATQYIYSTAFELYRSSKTVENKLIQQAMQAKAIEKAKL